MRFPRIPVVVGEDKSLAKQLYLLAVVTEQFLSRCSGFGVWILADNLLQSPHNAFETGSRSSIGRRIKLTHRSDFHFNFVSRLQLFQNLSRVDAVIDVAFKLSFELQVGLVGAPAVFLFLEFLSSSQRHLKFLLDVFVQRRCGRFDFFVLALERRIYGLGGDWKIAELNRLPSLLERHWHRTWIDVPTGVGECFLNRRLQIASGSQGPFAIDGAKLHDVAGTNLTFNERRFDLTFRIDNRGPCDFMIPDVS